MICFTTEFKGAWIDSRFSLITWFAWHYVIGKMRAKLLWRQMSSRPLPLVTRSRNKLSLVRFFLSFQAFNSQQRCNTFPKLTKGEFYKKKKLRRNLVLEICSIWCGFSSSCFREATVRWFEWIHGRLQAIFIFSERLTIGQISGSCAQKLARMTRDTGLPFTLLRIRVKCAQLETIRNLTPGLPAKCPPLYLFKEKRPGTRFSKVPKIFGSISGDILLFVSSKRRCLSARNFAVILIFIIAYERIHTCEQHMKRHTYQIWKD